MKLVPSVAGVMLTLACVLPGITQDTSPASSKPNILFVVVDDLNCALGCYGDVVAQTPHIDRLAATGIRFDRAYNQLPLCNPTRASVLTGLRPDTIKVYDLDRHFRDEVPDVVTLPQAFQKAGYRSLRVGKIYHYNVPASIGTDGLDDLPSWNVRVNPAGRDKLDERLVINAEPHRKISAALSWLEADGSDEEQTDGMIATEAIKLMESHRDQPFFLAVGFFRPHTPYVAPRKYFEMYPLDQFKLPYAPPGDRDDIPTAAFAHNCPVPNYGLPRPTLLKATQAFYACVSFIDAQVGRLLDALDRLQLSDNTIVVFWSDHGYHLGEHDFWAKVSLRDESAQVPLIISVPGKGPAVCQSLVELLDLFPTVAALCGLEVPARLQGKDISAMLDDPSHRVRDAAFSVAPMRKGFLLREDRWAFIQYGEDAAGGMELFDMHSDPQQFHNLANASQHQSRVSQFQQKLKAKLRAVRSNDL